MRKSLYSIGKPEPENGEAEKNTHTRRGPVRIPGNLMSLTIASTTKAGLGGTVRREPMRIEKTPQGRRFVRRNIINEIGLRTGGEAQGAVAKKFAQKDSSVQHSQGQGSAHTSSARAIPTPQSTMHIRNGATTSTIAVVSAAAQADVAAFPLWAWKPPPRVEAPRTPVLLTGKKPSAETIRVADAFIARSQRALDIDAPLLDTDGKSASGITSVFEYIQSTASQSTNGNERSLHEPLIQQSNTNSDDAGTQFCNKSSKESQEIPLTPGRLKRVAGINDATKPPKNSPMLELMRKSLASVVDSPRRPSLQKTKASGVTHSGTANDNRRNNSTSPPRASHKPDSPTRVLPTPVLGSEHLSNEYQGLPAQCENLDRSLQVSSPAPDVLISEIYNLVAEIRASHEEHIRREEQQIQRMARLEYLTDRIAKKQGLPARGRQPAGIPELAQPTGRLHSEPTIDVLGPKVSSDEKNKLSSETPAQAKEGLQEEKGALKTSRVSAADNSQCIQAKAAEADKPDKSVQNPQAHTEARHSTRLQDRRLRLGPTTPAWLIGRSRSTADTVTKNSSSSSVRIRGRLSKTPVPVSAKSNKVHFSSYESSRSKSPTPVAARETRAKSEAPFNSGNSSCVKTPSSPAVLRSRSRAKSEAPIISDRVSRAKTQTPVAAQRTRAQSEAPSISAKARAKTPAPVPSRGSRAKTEAPSNSRKTSSVKTASDLSRRRSRAKSTPLGSGKRRSSRSPSPTPVGSRRGRPRRSLTPTPAGSRKGRPRRSQSPKLGSRKSYGRSQSPASVGSRKSYGRSQSPTPVGSRKSYGRSQSPTPVGSRKSYGRSQSPTPVGSRKSYGRSQSPAPVGSRKSYGRSQSPTPVGSRKSYGRSQSPAPVGSRRGHSMRSLSPTPAGSRKSYSRSQSPTPASYRKRRHSRSQSPTPLGSGRGQSRHSQSPTKLGSTKRHDRSQSPTPASYRKRRHSRSQSPTPLGSGRSQSRHSQSPTKLGSTKRHDRSQSPTPASYRKRRHSRSQSPTPLGSGRSQLGHSQSSTSVGSGKCKPSHTQSSLPVSSEGGRPSYSQFPTFVVSERIQPKDSKIASTSSSPDHPKTGTKNIASAKRAGSASVFYEWEASNSAMSSKSCTAIKALDKHSCNDSPLATPLDVTVWDSTTTNNIAVQPKLKEISLPDKILHSKESFRSQLSEPAETNSPEDKPAASPCLIPLSEESLQGLASIEHSYSRSPWTARSLVADYSSFTESPSNLSKNSNSSNNSRVIHITKVCQKSPVKSDQSSTVCENHQKTSKTSSQREEFPREINSLDKTCFESPKGSETITLSEPKSPENDACKELLLKSPKSSFGRLQNPFVSLERLSKPLLASTSPDFSHTLREFCSPGSRPQRPNQEDLDLLMNSPLYAWMSSPASSTSGQKASAKSKQTPQGTQKTKQRLWRPSDLVKSKSIEKARKSIGKNPFLSNFKSPAKTPRSLLPVREASAKKSGTKESTSQATNRKSMIKYQKLRKSFPKLMMTPVNTPVSRSRINMRPLDSAAKTSRNVQAMLEMLEDA